MRARKRRLAAAALLLCVPAAALEHTPVIRLDAEGGQVFLQDFAGTGKSFGGTASAVADWLFSDGLKLSDSDTLIPTAMGEYQRRDSVNQIAGGSTLVSQTLDDNATLRWVHATGNWAVKPNVHYKNELVTLDNAEALGSGVFDTHSGEAGLQAEWKGDAVKSVRQDFTAGGADYYHYQTARSPLFGSELLDNDRVLDTLSGSYQLTVDAVPWEGGLATVSGFSSYIYYPHQRIYGGAAPPAVISVGTPRRDLLSGGTLAFSERLQGAPGGRPFEATLGAAGGYSGLNSNQNDLDDAQSVAKQIAFNSDYYSYGEYAFGPVLSAVYDKRWRADASYNVARRTYRHRPVQDPAGLYTAGGRVSTLTHSAALTLSYLVGAGFSVRASGGYVYARSNMKFERFNLYNYSYPYYFVGVGWAL